MEERLRLGELDIRLSRKAGNDVGREMDSRVLSPGAVEERAETVGRHSTPHPAQDGVGTGLEGKMKVGRDDTPGRDEVDQGFARLHRLEGGEPDPARRRAGLESPEERHEALSPVTSERRQVNSAEDDFGDPLRPESVDRLLDFGRGSAPLPSAKRWDDAEGTAPAAAVLDLQESARPPGTRTPGQRRSEDLAGRDTERGDFSGEEPRRRLLDQAHQLGRGTVPGDEIDLGAPREAVRVAFREASRHDEERGGVLPAEAPQQPERVAVGALRDGAGVHDQDVGGLSGTHARKARGLENPCQMAGLDLAHLAAKNVDVISSNRASGQAVRAGKRR